MTKPLEKLSNLDKLNIFIGFILILVHVTKLAGLLLELILPNINLIKITSYSATMSFSKCISFLCEGLFIFIIYYFFIRKKMLERLCLKYYDKNLFLLNNIVFLLTHIGLINSLFFLNIQPLFQKFSDLNGIIGTISSLILYILCSKILIGIKPVNPKSS